jgi:catechol 2,3-dioxygenase-like lactoylglutathione lyase family enzyme
LLHRRATREQFAMIRTHGLTHIALAVKNAKRSFEFYRKIFGLIKVYDQDGWIQAQTPGARDVIVFDESAPRIGKKGGVAHFGFRLVDPRDVDLAARAVKKAGGKVLDKGEFVPGEPYLFCVDPDGYVIETWYEPPTPVDSKSAK